MKHTLKTGIAVALLATALPFAAIAQDATTTTTTLTQAGDVDAGALIGKNIVDAKGDTVGEIDSVMVNAKGKVDAVIVDVSGWLESKKLISVPWSDLKQDGDGKITSSLTKEAANAATEYKYADDTRRGKVLTDNGEIYAGTTGADTGALGLSMGTPVKNGDGSINTSQLIGLNVENGAGDKVGKVGEIVLDKSGKVDGVIVDVGGFLGVGTHPVLLNWKDVQLTGNGDDVKAVVAADKEQLKAMPAYKAVSSD